MFTDWTQTDPKYFYVRGVILGVVLTTTVIMYVKMYIKNS